MIKYKVLNFFGNSKGEQLLMVLFLLIVIQFLKSFELIPIEVIVFCSVITMFLLYDLSSSIYTNTHITKMLLIALSASTTLYIAIVWVLYEVINLEIKEYNEKISIGNYERYLYSLPKILAYNGYTFRLTKTGTLRSYKKDNPMLKKENNIEYKNRIEKVKIEAKKYFKIT